MSMNLVSLQISNEFRYSKAHLVENMQNFYPMIKDEIKVAIQALRTYFSTTDFLYVVKGEVRTHTTKRDRYEYMQSLEQEDLEQLVWIVVSHVIAQQANTFTTFVGMIYKRFPHDTERMKLETASEVIGVLCTTQLMSAVAPRESSDGVMGIKSGVMQLPEVTDYVNGMRFNLPLLVPPLKLETNRDTGYYSFKGSVILSGKHHDHDVNLRHLNRLNATPFKLAHRVLLKVNPRFKEKTTETPLKRAKRYEQYLQCNTEGVPLYANFAHKTFYLTNRYCERVRTYTHGYHFNLQGDDYRKGALELAEAELVEG